MGDGRQLFRGKCVFRHDEYKRDRALIVQGSIVNVLGLGTTACFTTVETDVAGTISLSHSATV